MLDIILDTLLDGLKLAPFLFIAFFIIETIEHKVSSNAKNIVGKSGKFGPLVGSLLGLIPQCGFGVIATNLYVTRIVSMGTLIAIYLSTSDEMLPIMLTNNVDIKVILFVLVVKFIVGMIFGYIIDLVFRKKKNVRYDICDEEHCGCNHEHSLFKSSLIHTLKTLGFILVITFLINVAFEYLGEHYLRKLFMSDSIFAPFITSLVGLIPSCGASIMITELYFNNAINIGAMISGLLTGSGVSMLVLFRSNKDIKENFTILGLVYFIGVVCGLVIQLVMSII